MKLLFYVSKLYSIPVVQPLYKEALKRNIPCAFYVSSKVERSLPECFRRAPVFMELADAERFDPDYVLCPGNFVDFRLPGLKVELFHGIGVDKPSHYRIRHFFDFYFTSGPVVTDRFRNMERKFRYFRTFETGWPKIDHILKYESENLRDKYEVPPGRKVILYAPTHSRKMESAGEIVPVLDSIIRDDEIWFCKPHEFMSKDIKAELGKKNIRLIREWDITPFLHLADVLVSDTSSVIYEFMVLNRPVVTFRTTGDTDKCIDIQSADQLRNALDRSFSFPDEYSLQRHNHLQMVNPRLDGNISRGIIDLLLSEPEAAGKKPYNLFRKLQIIWHGAFRKGYLR